SGYFTNRHNYKHGGEKVAKIKTVIELLHSGAKKYGNVPYLGGKTGDMWQTISFKEADRLSSAFALSLLRMNYKKGDTISILAEGRPSWVISEFGLLKAGCISVPLSPRLSREELVFRLEHSESRALLVSENYFQRGAEALGASSSLILVCISPRNTHTEELARKFSFHEGKNLFYYDELIGQGKYLLNAAGGEGPELRISLDEIEDTISPDDTVTISYTGETGGNPRGIMLSHRNYLHNTFNSAEAVYVPHGWKSLIMLPLDHSFAHTVGLYIFLYRGLTMYFPDSEGGPLSAFRNLPSNLQEVNPDFLLTIPALTGSFMKKMILSVQARGKLIYFLFSAGLRAGIKYAGNGFDKPGPWRRFSTFIPRALANALIFPRLRAFFGKDIKFCVGGGAMLEIRQQEFFNAIGVPVYQGYGLTENAPIICANSAERHKFGTSGNIIPDLEVRIMKDGKECSTGGIGEIVIRGGSVMKGYFKNPEATAETLRDGCLWSGDLGYRDEDGFLVVTGREKDLLISADGEKYSPETIEEAVLNTSRFVNQIMVYNERRKFTGAFVTLNIAELKAAVEKAGIVSGGAGGTVLSDDDLDRIIDLVREDLIAFRPLPGRRVIPPRWRPASFAIIPGAFDESNGLINSTMKLVRHRIRDFYRTRIEEMYQGIADPHSMGNRAALRELFS
ncbi:MAG: AMP-binding protein, partial [Treponema sp.]|nr:AMP-binding protein [Treponema sp.]